MGKSISSGQRKPVCAIRPNKKYADVVLSGVDTVTLVSRRGITPFHLRKAMFISLHAGQLGLS